MALRCLLFTPDEGTAQSVRQALTDLGIEAEHCAVAVEAVQKVTNSPLNLLIVDWDSQTEAAFLLKTARERKASDRPLTLAIVSRDLNVSQALQAGANSILRKPIVAAQIRDSLTSARDLLRSRQDASSTHAAASAASAALPRDPDASTKNLRAGEFLQSTSAPGAQFVTEGDVQNKIEKTIEEAAVAELDPLNDLEPVAAAVETKEVAAPPPVSSPGETRGLEWYLKARGVTSSPAPAPAASPTPELLSYEQTPSSKKAAKEPTVDETIVATAEESQQTESARKTEAELVAYMSKGSEPERAVAKPRPALRRAILAAALVAVSLTAYIAVPQTRWRQNLKVLATNATHFAHNWLNPQTQAPAQVPTTHENFGLAGDEYKLPVAQNIPDATTDPTQIRVVPVVDPTAKRPNGAAASVDPATEETTPADPSNQNSTDQPQPAVQVPETAAPAPSSPGAESPTTSAPPPQSTVTVESSPADTPNANLRPTRRDPMQAVSKTNSRPQIATATISLKPAAGIPSSLKSQMAPNGVDPSSNKPVEAALPSIEPVEVPEATARGLLLEQPEPAYPEAAKGQQGRVVLQVLIGRDGSVQDSKFLQGSLAFARPASDGVRQWRFKPYNLNGRPVSIKTVLTLTFKPAS